MTPLLNWRDCNPLKERPDSTRSPSLVPRSKELHMMQRKKLHLSNTRVWKRMTEKLQVMLSIDRRSLWI